LEREQMSVREKIVGAFESKNLAWEQDFERAIDRLTAVGMSDSLGSALFRAKYCNDRESAKRALHLLTHKAAQRLKVEISYARNLSSAAFREWMVDTCDKCQGTGHAMESGHLVQCSKCSGTGAKRYTDAERAIAANLPIESWKKHESRFNGVVICLMGAVAETTGRVRELLS
jgi:DnaJ-class molecular chaperone